MTEAVFRRGLSDRFVAALARLAEEPGWWADVLADTSLVIAVRDERLNVYWHGQSLFRVTQDPTSGVIRAAIHPKYLIDPALGGEVLLSGASFDLGKLAQGGGFLSNYEGPATLGILKRNADRFAPGEKRGVHDIMLAHQDAVDIEVGLAAPKVPGQRTPVARADIAMFEDAGTRIRLSFWEAKPFTNQELWPDRTGTTAVLGQIATYADLLRQHRDAVLQSYRRVAQNLSTIAAMSHGRRTVSDRVARVASGATLDLDPDSAVGLVVFGYGREEASSPRWRGHRAMLETALGGRLRAAGSTSNLRLTKCSASIDEAVEDA
ncbi:hypothetical protein [Roseomonas rosulenta]|uniref:hypothetical protein n=1 Tax=Roseomonas rosulenta TaxID=2748667 RepID=UPI0018E02F1F|nr:hypothetical protein [Roseomonas rosulenta]